jgi:hypothetical protein
MYGQALDQQARPCPDSETVLCRYHEQSPPAVTNQLLGMGITRRGKVCKT